MANWQFFLLFGGVIVVIIFFIALLIGLNTINENIMKSSFIQKESGDSLGAVSSSARTLTNKMDAIEKNLKELKELVVLIEVKTRR